MNAARTPVFSCRKFSNWLVILAGVLISAVGQAQTFNDVPPDYWAYSSVENLAASGITGGCGGGSYCPENFVTRAQMAVFLERGMNGSSFSPPAASGNIFLDVSTTDFAANHIEQLFLDGVTGGCGGNNYCPDDVGNYSIAARSRRRGAQASTVYCQ